MKRLGSLAALVAFALQATACRSVATTAVANSFAGSGTGGVWAADDDPELIRDATPFGLKTMEALLESKPEHQGLLESLTSGFTQYAYAFVQMDADRAELEGRSGEAQVLRERAKRLFLRAREYGLRGLELRHPGLRQKLESVRDAGPALQQLDAKDVPLAYWTAASWALAISSGKEDMALVAELPVPGAMVERALALDESWDAGALHEFLVSYAAANGDVASAKSHYERARVLGRGQKLGTDVSFAEAVLVPAQDRDAFTKTLEGVLSADARAVREYRLANVLAQRRARLLLDHADDLFL
ncbi:MAG TPA: TRAP transporter TatT component family protein [Anaeromyxobacteraceae bacterium]|nr:TRAP transporter TatT component family protein [Anaeromyxobacteraceae bacterium]